LLVKKKADLGGNHVSQAAAGYGQEGWEVTLRFDTEGAKPSVKSLKQMWTIASRLFSMA
jgi:preprotein translocase subunit SecD